MGKDYHPHEIEEKWQRLWEENQVFTVIESADNPKYYLLEMGNQKNILLLRI